MLSFCDKKFPDRDVVVTGFGAVTGFGLSSNELWQALCSNQQAVRPLTPDQIDHWDALAQFLKQVPSAAVVDQDLVLQSLHEKLSRDSIGQSVVADFGFDLVNSMTLLALLEALQTAGLTLEEARQFNMGCVVGTSKPSLRAIEDWFAMTSGRQSGLEVGRLGHENTFGSALLPDACQRACCRLLNVTGPGQCPVAACATGLIAVLQGAMLIHQGVVDVCVVGSADASARASVMAAFHRLGVLSRAENPGSGCRPFDVNRDGFHVGEGAGILILESAGHASRRGHHADVRVAGGAWLTDPTGLTQIDATGAVVESVLDQLEDGRLTDLCSVHGTGTIPNDQCEANGLKRHFGASLPPSFGIKGATGHLLGAAGSVELGVAIQAMQKGVVLPTTNYLDADPQCFMNIESQLRVRPEIRSVSKLSLGFGGHVVGCRLHRES